MGGTQNIGEESDNPVEINVTAMVDVIFCLCIFFMCSFHFKQLEGKIDAWLPTKDGNQPTDRKLEVIFDEIRILMRWDPASGQTIRRVGNRAPASSDDELISTIQTMKQSFTNAGRLEVPVVIDATEDVPWQEVVKVLDLSKAQRLSPIKFAEPMQYRASNR